MTLENRLFVMDDDKVIALDKIVAVGPLCHEDPHYHGGFTGQRGFRIEMVGGGKGLWYGFPYPCHYDDKIRQGLTDANDKRVLDQRYKLIVAWGKWFDSKKD